ncbi:serine hydrolase domain-containing protein [Polaribacter sp.]|uniref:serine hydrolase domain-containing protein n=1 Tax=Polaribacter sp. TaxID=1920175 RepID=UPI003F69CCB6
MIRIISKSVLLIASLIINTLCNAQEYKAVVDSIAKVHYAQTDNRGLAIGIIEKGQQVTYYFGGKYTSALKDIDSQTLFELGSVTKLYTGHILAKMEQKGLLNRSDLLADFLPKSISEGRSWAKQIRLVDLATHTSGLPAFDSTRDLQNIKGFDENDPFSLFNTSFMLQSLSEIDEVPNYGQILYSNYGIGLLTQAMTLRAKMPFNVLFQNYLISDMKLSNTFLTLGEPQLGQVAIPHKGEEQRPLIQLYGMSGAGSIKASLPDLLTFLEYYLDTENTLVKSVLKDQLPDNEETVGLAWGIIERMDTILNFHIGGTFGSSSIVIIAPEAKKAVAILANNQLNGGLTAYALRIIDTLLK